MLNIIRILHERLCCKTLAYYPFTTLVMRLWTWDHCLYM